MSRAKAAWLAFALICAAFVWTTWPLRVVASENRRLLVVFYPDEATHFNQVASAAAAHTYQAAWEMGYGYAFFNLAQTLLLLRPPVSDQQIILTLRTVEWAFAVATLVFVFVAVRRVSTTAALLATAALATLPLFVRWSVISHPDMMQLLFIWMSLYASARRLDHGQRGWTLAASAAAGVAFASKFAGMFLLPLIWAADLIAQPQSPYDNRIVRVARTVIVAAALVSLAAAIVLSPAFVAAHLTSDGSIQLARSIQLIQQGRLALLVCGLAGLASAGIGAAWRRLLASPIGTLPVLLVATACAFFTAFTVTSAQAWRGLHFVRMLILNASVPAIDQQAAQPWLTLLISRETFTAGVAALALAGAAWALMRLRDLRGRSALEGVHVAWVLLFGLALVLSLRGHDLPAYYLLPIIPSMLFLAARGWEAVWTMSRRWPPWLARAAAVVLVAAVVVELGYDVQRVAAVRREVLDEEQDSRPVQFGGRLACYVAPRARILFDYFSYVPPVFTDAQVTWGGSLALLRDRNPDAVVVNTTIEGFYRAPRGNVSVISDDDPYRYYAALRDDRTPYRLVAADGPVRLYVRAGSPYLLNLNARGCS